MYCNIKILIRKTVAEGKSSEELHDLLALVEERKVREENTLNNQINIGFFTE